MSMDTTNSLLGAAGEVHPDHSFEINHVLLFTILIIKDPPCTYQALYPVAPSLLNFAAE